MTLFAVYMLGVWAALAVQRRDKAEVLTYIARLTARLVELGSPCMVQNTARRGYALRFPDRKVLEFETPLVPAA